MTKDAELMHIESDIQKIQIKENMYIQEYGAQGTFHLARELIQNCFDECLDKDSNGNTIEISYDVTTGILTCEDNGRGFLENKYPMNIFCEKIQSGSKFFRAGSADSAGEFGVGMTVVNALSDFFKLESYREKEKTHHIIEYHEGKLIKDEFKSNKNGKHGTVVHFRPSEKYLGENCELPIEDMLKWIEVLFYLNSDNLKDRNISCKVFIYNGLELLNSYKFKPKPFYELINKILPNHIKKKDMSSMVVISDDTTFTEKAKTLIENDNGTKTVDVIPTKKHIHLDIAFEYCTSVDINEPATYDTYCNYTNTIKNGVHLTTFDECFCRYLQNAVNDTLSNSQKEKMKITWDDVRCNLFAIVNLSSNASVGFEGNQKESIRGSKELNSNMKELINNMISNYFNDNQSVLSEFIKIIKLNAKARIEAAKIKTASQTERLNTFKEFEMSNYIRCNNTGKQWKELFILEGESASSSARNACYPDFQAIYLLKGVVFNVVKANSFADTMNNNEWKGLGNVLKCGVGPNFDMSKLYFDRINIMTDADIDGFFISAGVLAFFYYYLRPIIEAGKLYKVYSPLYSLNDKEYKFANNKGDLIKIFHKKIIKNYKIKTISSKSYFDKDEFKEFLNDVYDYRENLINAADQSGKINKYLIELIAALLIKFKHVRSEFDFDDIDTIFGNQKNIKNIMTVVQNKFKEITVNESGIFYGPVEGRIASIKVGPRFYKKISSLIPIYEKYGYELIVEESGKEPIQMTIGEFLDYTYKLFPEIKSRFKGLSELNADELRETTMDINNRFSVQYTVDDVERELAIFNMTHGSSKQDVLARKKLMKEYKIKREDLDN